MSLSVTVSLVLLVRSPTCLGYSAASLSDIVRNLTASSHTQQEVTHQELRAGQRETLKAVSSVQQQLETLQQRLTASHQPEERQCPAGWSRHGDRCYLMPPGKSTWLGAAAACAALDRRSRLASVHPDSHEYIQTLLVDSDADNVWLGLVRLNGGVNWAWVDGSAFDFSYWRQGQPANDGGNREDCVFMRSSKHPHAAKHGEWHDGGCIVVLKFLCQIQFA